MAGGITIWFTTVTAGVGAALGIFNLWRQVSADRVKLRVTPSLVLEKSGTGVLTYSKPIPDGVSVLRSKGYAELAVEVINLSSFSVVIDEVGLALPGERRILFPAYTGKNERLPIELKPRHALRLYSQKFKVADCAKAKSLYVETSCGYSKTASSPALDQLLEAARS